MLDVAIVFLPVIGAIIAGFFGRAIGDRGAELVTSSGTKIRKPHAALRPSPTQILKSSSILSENTVRLRFVAVILRFKSYADFQRKRLQMSYRIGNRKRGRWRFSLSRERAAIPPRSYTPLTISAVVGLRIA